MISLPSIGCGLLSIGRAWGIHNTPPPSEKDAFRFLEGAIELGLTLFDTAPSYGSSEPRLGACLKTLDPGKRDRLIIATKMGEHWDDDKDSPYVDHGYDALCRNIDQSLERLGRIDLLQLHIATAETVISDDVLRAVDYAINNGIPRFGASTKELETVGLASESPVYSAVQISYNQLNQSMASAFPVAAENEMAVLINRPLAMGKLATATDKQSALRNAFAFVRHACPTGTILTGTRSLDHLKENLEALRCIQNGNHQD